MKTSQDFIRYPVLHALIDALPDDGEWTDEERDRWTKAFVAALDFYIRIIEIPS